ncbi:MAG: GtrA family protein [Atopobiaceae bacterium]|nr:GtrA family protein [Atopobiaceae bacterium]
MGFNEWKEKHQTVWEFILFNILSNVSTATRFVVTWIGNALTGGVGGIVVTFASELLAQVVNFFVQMKFVFKSTADFSKSAPKYAVLAILIIAINSFALPALSDWLINAGILGEGIVRNGIQPVAGTLLAVIISFPMLKFWIAPDDK